MSGRGWVFLIIIVIMIGGGWLIFSGKKLDVSTKRVTKEAKEALQATQEYTAQQKQAFQKAMHGELVTMERHIDSLKAKSRTASGQARADLQLAIQELEQKKAVAAQKLAKLQSSSAQAWTEAKSATNEAFEDMKQSYKKAAKRVRD